MRWCKDWGYGVRTGAVENGQSKEPCLGWAVHAEVQEESQNVLGWKGP